MRTRARRLPAAVVAAIALTACGSLIPAADAGEPPFPECEADAYAFIGETSLAELGLREQWPEAAGRVGEVWVTAGPPDPAAWPMPPGAPPIDQRVICVEFADGSGMAGPIDDAWRPPGAGMPLAAGSEGSLLAVVAVPIAVLVVGAVSYLAFRRDHLATGTDRSN